MENQIYPFRCIQCKFREKYGTNLYNFFYYCNRHYLPYNTPETQQTITENRKKELEELKIRIKELEEHP